MDTAVTHDTPSSTTPCPFCGVQIDAKDYYCPNCGKKVREKPLSTSFGRQLVVYAVSLFLPPFGLVWIPRYWKMSGVGKKIALAIIILTVISLAVSVWVAVDFVHAFDTALQKELNTYPSLGY
jgi:hypothetical protein